MSQEKFSWLTIRVSHQFREQLRQHAEKLKADGRIESESQWIRCQLGLGMEKKTQPSKRSLAEYL